MQIMLEEDAQKSTPVAKAKKGKKSKKVKKKKRKV